MGPEHGKRQILIQGFFVSGNDNGFGTADFELTGTPINILQRAYRDKLCHMGQKLQYQHQHQ